MHCVTDYLKKQRYPELTGGIPVGEKIDLIVVIPCYNESYLIKTLESLASCERGDFFTEIILLVNAYHSAPHTIFEINRKAYAEAVRFALDNNVEKFNIIPLLIEDLPAVQPGAGLPRKIGMDEALRRLVRVENPQGIIVSLDADCMVEKNYLTELNRCFETDTKLCSATIEFHHPVEHLPDNDPIRKAMLLYEAYLRYYRLALECCGFPYPYYTIGSAMAFRASVYARAGGMVKQQAGEDFYFLQKVFPLGKSVFIDSTCVYPEARLSDRVPFGTGPALIKMINQGEIAKNTYSFESFEILKLLFDDIDCFFKCTSEVINTKLKSYPALLSDFLNSDNFIDKMDEISSNTSSIPAYRKRFFNYFNAFKIVKYLNFVHAGYLELQEVCGEYKKCMNKSLSLTSKTNKHTVL